MKIFLYNLTVFLICLILLSLWGFYSAIRPYKIHSNNNPKSFGLSYENIEFVTADNIKIKGWFIPAKTPAKKTIILLHGYPADKGDTLPSRVFLQKKYNLLFLDFRYLGESGGNYSTVGKREVLDVLGAIKYLQQRGINEIGIWGFSLGGAVALMTAKESSAVKAVIAESSYATLNLMARDYFQIPVLKYPLQSLLNFWAKIFLNLEINSVSPVDDAAQLSIPVLIINSKNDTVISAEHAELFQQKLNHKSNIQLLIFDQAHGVPFKDYQKIIEDFFGKNL